MRSLISRLQRLVRDRDGVVAIETALILPLTVVTALGMSYVSTVGLANKKAQTAAYAVANMAPYPRDHCTFVAYIQSQYVNGYLQQVLGEVMSPFPTANQDLLIRFQEEAVATDQVNIRAISRYDYRVSASENPVYAAFDRIRGVAPETFQIGATSADVALDRAPGPCPAETPLTVTGPAPAEISAGSPASSTLQVTGGLPAYSFTRTGGVLPPGMSFDAVSGAVTGTADTSCSGSCDPATFVASYEVRDSTDKLWYDKPQQVASHSGSITVVYQLRLDAPDLTVTAGSTVTSAAMTRFGGKPGYSFSASGLPPGLAVDSAGRVTGTPSTPGTYNVVGYVTDGRGQTANDPFVVTVNPPPFDMTISPDAVARKLGENFEVTITTQGGFGAITVTCDWVPAGVICDGPGRKISGAAQSVGTGNIIVRGRDASNQEVVRALAFNFTADPLVVSGTSVSATAGVSMFADRSVTGGYGTRFVSCSGLPAGLSCAMVSGNVRISGTPSAPGTGTIVVTVTDGGGSPSTPTNIAYAISSPAMASYFDPFNPSGRMGQYGSIIVKVTGGFGTLTLESVTGQPSGYTVRQLDGRTWEAYGTASSYGAGTITFRMRDNFGQSTQASRAYYIAPPVLNAWNGGQRVTPTCTVSGLCSFRYQVGHSGGVGTRYVSDWNFYSPNMGWSRGSIAVGNESGVFVPFNPNQLYSYQIEGSTIYVNVSDGAGQTAQVTINPTVSNAIYGGGQLCGDYSSGSCSTN